MEKIIIDTDPGQDIDDLLVLWFALLRPELDIKAITTVTQPSEKRAKLVKRLLRYLDRTDIPVAAGLQFPMRKMDQDELKRQQDESITMNHYAFAEPEDPADDPVNKNAVKLIIDTVIKYPGEIILACIAPLTNIASALQQRPDIASKIKYIALMGGEVALDQVEHNIAFDHIAASIVLNSGIPVYMGTWSVTRQFSFTMEECEVFRNHNSQLAKKMAEAIELWHPIQNWKPGPVMYDMFPILLPLDLNYYTCEQKSVEIVSEGEEIGKTILSGNNKNIYVTTGIQPDKIKQLYLQTVLSS
jgi:inosine-uridine nucleoside N-ribohydrolase